MRGRVCRQGCTCPGSGITPAYAGKRTLAQRMPLCLKDHPRVCGEEVVGFRPAIKISGSPPRMRGRAQRQKMALISRRITPAYAGKRVRHAHQGAANQDHPRVCGEEVAVPVVELDAVGSPPRMRGRGSEYDAAQPVSGITPAYAGKSTGRPRPSPRGQDHPRVCGEECTWASLVRICSGSPPAYAGKRLNGSLL